MRLVQADKSLVNVFTVKEILLPGKDLRIIKQVRILISNVDNFTQNRINSY